MITVSFCSVRKEAALPWANICAIGEQLDVTNDIIIKVSAADGQELPQQIYIREIDREVCVSKGTVDSTTQIEYKNDGTITIPSNYLQTGSVTIIAWKFYELNAKTLCSENVFEVMSSQAIRDEVKQQFIVEVNYKLLDGNSNTWPETFTMNVGETEYIINTNGTGNTSVIKFSIDPETNTGTLTVVGTTTYIFTDPNVTISMIAESSASYRMTNPNPAPTEEPTSTPEPEQTQAPEPTQTP